MKGNRKYSEQQCKNDVIYKLFFIRLQMKPVRLVDKIVYFSAKMCLSCHIFADKKLINNGEIISYENILT